ncbi:MAG TPA: ABC transporter ATP-binding protein [Thermoplasmata archaeon]|nr:ABC transporter ATP-binding protein [Thermoplasmata archaeon]
MLAARGLSKTYCSRRGPAIDRVSLEVQPREAVGLVGLNGAGKTTTLRITCGVSLPTAGEVEVDGISLQRDKASASRLIGWVPEQPTHDPSATLRSLLRYYSDIAAGVPAGVGERLLSEWGLSVHANKRFRELSLGLKRRFAIVVASLTQPRYYLLDEPFNGLDPVAMAQCRTWVVRAKEEGTGLLLSSHNLREVQSLCDRVVVIHEGRVRSSVSAAQLARLAPSAIVVVVDRMDPDAVRILERFGEVTISGTTANLRSHGIDAGQVNAALVLAGYVVRKLSVDEGNLENYFLRLIEEAG